MKIRPAEPQELAAILEIYASARGYMRQTGNPTQWEGGYPSEALVREDIAAGRCMLCVEGEELLAVFCCMAGPDPTYLRIDDGEWLNDLPYFVIHRIAVGPNAHRRGVASFCFDYGLAQCGNLKIDTHRDNLPMQHALAKNGFSRCGIIYLENGDERIAYQKCCSAAE
ncbi:MAG: GNAT family N-acetyltransferase [Clostridia bacterium]|nr:GNAT family N-acetyltransferase [Clostridia bacterium]